MAREANSFLGRDMSYMSFQELPAVHRGGIPPRKGSMCGLLPIHNSPLEPQQLTRHHGEAVDTRKKSVEVHTAGLTRVDSEDEVMKVAQVRPWKASVPWNVQRRMGPHQASVPSS